ncbi:polyhydroxybutyrate depolymerase [Myxococcota bacterium]|nr:polyhydroxybutyrate depolymerase [Myxococcota bacterium]
MRSGWLRLALGLLLVGGGLILLASRYLQFSEAPLPVLKGTVDAGSLLHAGRERNFLVYEPVVRDQPTPIVLVLHGSQGNAMQARSMMSYEFDRLADEFGFLAVYPAGVESHWNDCRAEAPYAANELDVDDVGFLSALVDRLVEERGADRTRVYATGVSNGGQMAFRLALEAPDLVRAVAPVVANLPAPENFDCRHSGRAESVLLMNGSKDPMNPDEGGRVALYGIFGDRGQVLSTRETIDYWRDLAGHMGEPERVRLPDRSSDDDSHVEVTRWSESGREEVVLYHIVGGGHTVPHPLQQMPKLLGATNADVYAAREIWKFFQANAD